MNLDKAALQTLERYWCQREEFERQVAFLSTVQNELSDSELIRLRSMKFVTNAMKELYKNLDDSMKKIIDMRYQSDALDWIEIADQLNCSRQKVLNKRIVCMKKLAEKIGFL